MYDDLTFFTLRGFIESSVVDEDPLPESAEEWNEWLIRSGVKASIDDINPYEEESFALTDKGLAFTKNLYDVLTNTQRRLYKISRSDSRRLHCERF